MIKILNSMSAITLITTLSACGTNAPADNAAALNDTGAIAADSANPFAESEMKMNKAMAAAVGTSTTDNWVRMMIEHHRGAVDMSRIVLTQSPTADVAKMAQSTIDKQGQEIIDLEKLITTGNPDTASAELYRPAATQMHNAMMTAKGADISETYLSKMLAHHKGAVAMSDIALANGATGAVRTQIAKTRGDQQMEVGMVEAMLRGEPMMSMAPASAKTVVTGQTGTPTASKPVAPRTPAKAKPAEAAADPHAGMDMNNM